MPSVTIEAYRISCEPLGPLRAACNTTPSKSQALSCESSPQTGSSLVVNNSEM
ncbi:hypothetical protein CY34DRAFT_809825 [Suillus luteus UH-Slu-Lm8-n1]|uniref:Uncharacterized protein n=1 Tax=Suillus luteus UH-Slu-Lm8-n1 TaxID=930992 RepID=A0A0D0AUG8_9AGAM|nr:hypothetical protein CY34DRAFT_809825 [Suillus luteus UH-Slu-Lm8-n1]